MQRLGAYLKEHGIAQKTFADDLGVSPSYVSQLCAEEPTLWPSRALWVRIRRLTANIVTPNDHLPPYEPPVAG